MKIINNITPFNDLFYKNCFYNSLFPIIKCFNKSMMPILLNDVIVYETRSKENLDFACKYLSISKINDLLDNMGIKMKSLGYTEDLIFSIKKSIDKNRPIILRIDPFYMPIRKDAYKKQHQIHTILVYGYDDNMLNIIELKHRDTLSYEECTISFEDINNSYKGYYENFKDSYKAPSYFEFNNDELKEKDDKKVNYYEIFKRNMRDKKSELLNGFTNLDEFIQKLKKIIIDVKELNEFTEGIIFSLNSVINAKYSEIYTLSMLNGIENKVLDLQKECNSLWQLIRGRLVKYNFTGKYKRETFIEVVEMLDRILEFELYYLKYITV